MAGWQQRLGMGVAIALLAGCQDLPGTLGPLLGPVTGGGGANPVLHGTVSNPQAGLRVGLIGQPQAGGARVELVSASASTGSYALQLIQPGIDMLQQPAEDKSFIFLLQPYLDLNGNDRYDDGTDRLVEGAGGASFRWFANGGPSYQAGWNVYDPTSGQYSQSFSTAYNL